MTAVLVVEEEESVGCSLYFEPLDVYIAPTGNIFLVFHIYITLNVKISFNSLQKIFFKPLEKNKMIYRDIWFSHSVSEEVILIFSIVVK